MDGGVWWAAVHGVAKSRARLSDFTFTFHFHALEKEMATHSSILAWKIPWTEESGNMLKWAFPGGVSGKELTCQCRKHSETWVPSLGGEDPLEKGMPTHSSILVWEIPWTEEPGRVQPMWLESETG